LSLFARQPAYCHEHEHSLETWQSLGFAICSFRGLSFSLSWHEYEHILLFGLGILLIATRLFAIWPAHCRIHTPDCLNGIRRHRLFGELDILPAYLHTSLLTTVVARVTQPYLVNRPINFCSSRLI
jgi:hypothetical protein